MTDAAKTEQELVEWAASFGPVLAEHAEQHDREGTFVTQSFGALRDAGLLAIGVPADLGGRGATPRQVAMVQRELAKYCGSTALASSMHQHIVQFAAWRYRRGMPGADAVLKAVLDDKIVLVTSGGSDFTRPKGKAVKVDGGYRVTATKVFASQAPAGTVFSTLFPFDDPEQGTVALNMSIPFTAEGVTIKDNWDTLGMRGTGSNDVDLADVFVPDEAVSPPFPYGVIHPPLQVIGQLALSIVSAVYLGVAEGAFAHAVDVAKSKREDPSVQRMVGLMRTRLDIAAWALDGVFAVIGDDPMPSMEAFARIGSAKTAITEGGIEVCDLALQVAGGPGFFKGSPLERAYRDIRAIKYHPLTPEKSLLHSGQFALGLPADDF